MTKKELQILTGRKGELPGPQGAGAWPQPQLGSGLPQPSNRTRPSLLRAVGGLANLHYMAPEGAQPGPHGPACQAAGGQLTKACLSSAMREALQAWSAGR